MKDKQEESTIYDDLPIEVAQNLAELREDLDAKVPFKELDVALPASVLDILADGGVCGSRGEAKRAIRQGGVSINGVRVANESDTVSKEQLRQGRYLFVRAGRKNFHMISVSGSK